MNTRTSLVATAAAMALFGSANAAVTPAGNQTIDITGSTAGRSTVHTNIITQLGGAANVAVRFYRANGATVSASSADGAIYKGTFNSETVIVRTFWAGSASGVDSVSNQAASTTPLTNKFIDVAQVASAGLGTSSQVGTGLTGAPLIASGILQAAAELAEFGYSDVKQAATPYQTTPLASETNMFVIPFAMYKTADLTNVTNVTNQQMRGLFTGGGIAPKSLFTGLTGDSGTNVYAVGRDNDSGTRITFAAETGTGVFTDLSQFTFTVAGSGNTATINTPVATSGTGGYASGGSVATVLGASGFSCIGYVGLSDGATAAGLGAAALTFNGVPYSQANVRNGSYTFWSYYQSILSSATTDQNALDLHAAMETALLAITSSDSAINLGQMAVGRQADGSTINF